MKQTGGGERRHKCGFCPKSFQSEKDLDRHQWRIHSVLPEGEQMI